MASLTPEQIQALKEEKKHRSEEKMKKRARKERKDDRTMLGKPKQPRSPFLLFLMDQEQDNAGLKVSSRYYITDGSYNGVCSVISLC